MYILFLLMTASITLQASSALLTTPIQRKPQPLTLAQEMSARFGNKVIQLTNAEYRQLVELAPLTQYIAPDRTVKAADLLTILLSNYQLSRPKIYCIRAPCPQPALVTINNELTNIEIQLTDSDFSEIIESLNL